MDDLKYYFLTHPQSMAAGVLRRYRTGEIIHSEQYNFRKPGWESTTYFMDYRRGHIDFDYEETTAEEAQEWIQEGGGSSSAASGRKPAERPTPTDAQPASPVFRRFASGS